MSNKCKICGFVTCQCKALYSTPASLKRKETTILDCGCPAKKIGGYQFPVVHKCGGERRK